MDIKVSRGETSNFSKYILKIVVALYFAGTVLGGLLVIVAAANDIHLGVSVDAGMFIAYTAYLGGPTATAIGFYAWKSKAENMLKIGQSFHSEQVTQVIETIANMEDN